MTLCDDAITPREAKPGRGTAEGLRAMCCRVVCP